MIQYVVQPGDTLTIIAMRYGTTVQVLVETNNLANPDIIFAGQVIFIPTSGTPSPPTPPAPPPRPPAPPPRPPGPPPRPPGPPPRPPGPPPRPPGPPPRPPGPPPRPPGPPPRPPGPPPRPPGRPSVTRTFDGVEYTMTLNKSVYSVGEPIIMRLVKKNILRVPLTLTYRTTQKVDFRITRDSVFIWQWSRGRFFAQGINSVRLQPREERVYRVDWNQRTDSSFLRPGTYSLTGWNLATPGVRLTLQFRIR